MNVLHILPYVPLPLEFGGALRIYHLLKTLVQNHDVTVISYGTPQNRGSLLSAFGSRLKRAIVLPHPWTRSHRRFAQLVSLCTSHSFFYSLGYSRQMQQAIDAVLRTEHIDVVQTEFSTFGVFDLNTSAVKIIDAHNVEYDNFRRMAVNGRTPLRSFFYDREYRKCHREELEACARYDAMFVTSERDKSLFEAGLPRPAKFVIPNGVDPDYFHPIQETPEPFSMVFTGMMGYVPNYDGMIYFLDQIFPLILHEVPQAKVWIVGKRPPRMLQTRATDNVIVTGQVEDVRPYVWNASVYIVPLRMGSGTRLKVFEALAMKKPIVTTTIGCEGIDVKNQESALIEDSPQEFARAVVELFRNPPLRQTLAQNGHDLVRSRYAWSIIGQQINNAYRSLCQKEEIQPVMETA